MTPITGKEPISGDIIEIDVNPHLNQFIITESTEGVDCYSCPKQKKKLNIIWLGSYRPMVLS